MKKQQVDSIFTAMLESYDGVSDLLMTVDKPFQVEASGQLKPVNLEPSIEAITPFQAEMFALNLVNSDRRLTTTLVREGSCDSSYALAGKARFRVNIFSQKGYYSIVMRQLATRIPTIEELNLPEAFKKMTKERNGIILVTGSTGSGKSTSLAAVLNEINESQSVHVVTLEDPVEFVHSQKTATFNQREMGQDFDSFASGLRAALRQAPKIILVGEMRDRETVEIGLSAAETGHGFPADEIHVSRCPHTSFAGLAPIHIHPRNSLNTRNMSVKVLVLDCFIEKPRLLFEARFENGFSSILMSMIIPLRCFTSHAT